MTPEDGFMIRLSLPEQNGTLLRTALSLTNKLLLSASVFWQPRQGRFCNPGSVLQRAEHRFGPSGHDSPNVALDSAGFTAMRHWGGYPWSVADYVHLAAQLEPVWWAQMDYCCEPEIAHDRAEVRDRMMRTVETLISTLHMVDELQDAHGVGYVSDPMPVLQGRTPGDYCTSAGLVLNYLEKMDRGEPWLLGVGSVCRRKLSGYDGILSILDALDRELPRGTRASLLRRRVRGDLRAIAASPLALHRFYGLGLRRQERGPAPGREEHRAAARAAHDRVVPATASMRAPSEAPTAGAPLRGSFCGSTLTTIIGCYMVVVLARI